MSQRFWKWTAIILAVILGALLTYAAFVLYAVSIIVD